MRKSLFAIGLLAAINSVQAQNVLVHVDDAATTYVSKGTLVYSGGGLQMKGSGIVENHGNFMVNGTSTDSFKTIDASNVNKTEANGGGNFVNKLNEPTAYATYNTNSSSATPAYTYGQLFISGIPQTNITGIVDQEYRAVNHGTYQQIGLPFYDKTASTLSTELGKTFTNTRYSKNEILAYSNPTVVSMNVDITSKLGVANPGTAYYMLGGLGLDVSNTTRTLKGRPLTDIGTTVTLQNAGNGINFGTGGSATNMYNEKYYTYLQDGFHIGSGGTAWQGNYGRNIYQFSNPFLTNIDLSQIAVNEGATVGDGINLTKIQGVRLEVSGVQTASSTGGSGGTGSSSYKFITYPSGVPTGDVDYTVVRPMGTFVIKLLDNTSADTFNFANLRRFNYYSRAASTNYSVAANKNSSGTVKQLGVIGLDANGNEVARTYYVVYPNGTTGHSTNALTQVTLSSGDILGTFEEDVNGGYDNNYTGQYWLYINEANEFNFKGKNIKLVNYDLNKIKSYKFEIRENAQLVANGTHALSTGIGFYYKAANGTLQQAVQGGVTSVTNAEYDLYYGEPNVVLATTETKSPSRTVVIYNPAITNYIVRFDPNWKKADIEVYDMSGKLVISKKAVETTRDFVIELDQQIKNSYVVKIVSDKGDIVNTKILK
ncbi:T9SS type A sorting domain-containing protein [Chryseobacterium sp. PS-8]|uniref:T9SS type A sorting domain-containing protein n=1 Tax=Chryseobacterium indicum TaxID=2766954 RepID=A0ABS9CAR3_9FLAO|nr:T9SS type A sorting domain-containing protein [Chryseobacterium sp. PS-8]MCF2221659.1 T9SS type A sorting domain-containing protein [Chryseobacterium sp. PS-8]